MTKKDWNIAKSVELYNVNGWGNPYFSVNRTGHVVVHPKGNKNRSINLRTLVEQITERGIQTPFLLRFNDIITHRLDCISSAFETAIQEFSYTGKYSVIYPIKVNQQKHVVDQIV